MSVRPHETTRFPLNGCFFQIWYLSIIRKLNFHYNTKRITGTSYEDIYTFVIVSRSVLLRIRKFPDKFYRENLNTYFTFNNSPPRKSYRLWDNVEKYGSAWQATDDIIIWHMRVACRINNGYRHAPRICNTILICSTTPTIGTRARLICYYCAVTTVNRPPWKVHHIVTYRKQIIANGIR